MKPQQMRLRLFTPQKYDSQEQADEAVSFELFDKNGSKEIDRG